MISRPITKLDVYDLEASCMIQLAVEFSNKNVMFQVIDNLQKSIIGLHLKTDDKRLIYTPEEVKVAKIPDNLQTLQEATEWVVKNNTPNYKDRIASLSASDNKVVLNINHAMADGGYFKYIIDHLFYPPSKTPYFTRLTTDIFSSQISSSPDTVKLWQCDPNLTRIQSKSKLPKVPSSYAKYHTFSSSTYDFKCYNPRTQKCDGLTETFWLSLILSTAAHNGFLDKTVGCCTCVDLRPYLLPHENDFSIGNCFSEITASTPISLNATLRDVGARMREDLMKRNKRGEAFGFLKNIGKPMVDPIIPGVGLEISNVGLIKIKKPIKDVWMSLSMQAKYTEDIVSLMGFSVLGNGRNDTTIRFRYCDSKLADDETKSITNSIEYFFKNISLDKTVGDALDELKYVQKL
ncbi:hypothetical protein GPJ56_001844 [Histomonas meleagridis]|uniref:uncharacterized protein n=1 Tax=Histomonas meleagridis TaxID=135588 RepID=UPI003559A5DE|nr:hypothetical protein GPJ56_001844 [Histomonas meleagridis]KAH0803219.1 hypothetical protein GO595_003955 [Histomonas meleagridis]